jgi:HK97 family phage major capsid protein
MTLDLKKAINEATTTAGGYFVPDEQAKIFLELVQQNNTAIPLCRSFTMATDVLNIPTVTAGNTAYWVSENTDITTSDITTGQVTLTAKKVAALSTVSSEVLEDSNPEIAQVLNEQLGKDVAIKVDQEIYNGGKTGYTDSGIKGFRDTTTYTDINTVNANSGEISVDLILQAKKAIRNDYYPDGGTHMVINPDIVYKLEGLVDSNGRPLFSAMDTNNPLYSNGVLGRVLGLTVVVTPAVPTSSNLSDAIILTKGVTGYYGMKRGFNFHKEYQIESDNYKIQTNMRMAFRVAYQKSAAIIYDIKTN